MDHFKETFGERQSSYCGNSPVLICSEIGRKGVKLVYENKAHPDLMEILVQFHFSGFLVVRATVCMSFICSPSFIPIILFCYASFLPFHLPALIFPNTSKLYIET